MKITRLYSVVSVRACYNSVQMIAKPKEDGKEVVLLDSLIFVPSFVSESARGITRLLTHTKGTECHFVGRINAIPPHQVIRKKIEQEESQREVPENVRNERFMRVLSEQKDTIDNLMDTISFLRNKE